MKNYKNENEFKSKKCCMGKYQMLYQLIFMTFGIFLGQEYKSIPLVKPMFLNGLQYVKNILDNTRSD
jgi:ABC-type tungstate transport system substrate-binding protein